MKVELFRDEGGEFRRPAAFRLDALGAQPGDDLGARHRFGHRDAELVDDGGRRPAGASNPNQLTACIAGSRASAMVGTSGSRGERASPLMASAAPSRPR